MSSVYKYSYIKVLGNSFLTYSIISWWCRMHAFNLACKSLFAIVWICSSFCPCWGVICCCLMSSMAVFTLSNWLQATAINVVIRDGKPQIMPSANSVAKNCKKVNNYKSGIW